MGLIMGPANLGTFFAEMHHERCIGNILASPPIRSQLEAKPFRSCVGSVLVSLGAGVCQNLKCA